MTVTEQMRTVIDPKVEEYRWFVIWTVSREHIHLIQTLLGTTRESAASKAYVCYRRLDTPEISEAEIESLSRQILERKNFWRWDEGGTERFDNHILEVPRHCFMQVVD